MSKVSHHPTPSNAQEIYQNINDRLMRLEDIEEYALGEAALIVSVSPGGEIVLTGIHDDYEIDSISGMFLRLDFDRYWVCNPTRAEISRPSFMHLEYKDRMVAWLELIPMLPHERTRLNEALSNVVAIDHPSFDEFIDMLISSPSTQHEIRCDLAAHLCNPKELALRHDKASRRYRSKSASRKRLVDPYSQTPQLS